MTCETAWEKDCHENRKLWQEELDTRDTKVDSNRYFFLSDFERTYPKRWGPWFFHKEDLTLVNAFAFYDVDLEQINNKHDVLHWIFNISGKNYKNYGGVECLSWFIAALRDIFPFDECAKSEWNGTTEAKAYANLAFPRRNVSPKLRHQVLERDGFRCCDCGVSAQTPGVVLEVDHRKPVSRGGTNDISNLRTLCKDCNIGKSDREIDYPEDHR